VVGVLLAALLAAMAVVDRRARARGARVRRDIAEGVARGSASDAAGDARMHDAQHRAGNSFGL
jgi:putative effector of murein hydrolase